MRLEVERSPLPGLRGTAVMRLSGVIDTTTLTEFEKRLQEATDDGIDRLLLDLEKVRYINSSGFGALVKYSDHFKARGGGLGLVHVPPKVQVVLEMLGLQAFFPIFPSQESAEEALGSSSTFPAPQGAPAEVSPSEATAPMPPPAAPIPSAAPASSTASAPVAEPALATAAPTAPAAPATYPLSVSCAVCSATLEVRASGHYRCPGCSAVFKASPEGHLRYPETDEEASAVHVALDTGTIGRRALEALVGTLAAPHMGTRTSAAIPVALGEILDWIQGGSSGAPVRVNALLISGASGLRLDLADSGPDRDVADLEHANRLFGAISRLRVSQGRSLTRFTLAPEGSPSSLVESPS